jgi:uncharacterized protein
MNLHARPERRVTEIENVFIEMSDGCRLAARIWLPEDAETNPVPAILEYIPYRKRDGSAARDQTMHPAVAAQGYACVRVDIRGNGESDGLMRDEYLPQELADGAEVIGWIAEQPWCSGDVGMLGISWGGFNGLQVAALRPPALAGGHHASARPTTATPTTFTIAAAACSNDNLAWSATMMAFSSRPPDPLLVGERWREMWLERLQQHAVPGRQLARTPAPRRLLEARLGLRGLFRIEVPVLAVGGWADPYSNAIPGS